VTVEEIVEEIVTRYRHVTEVLSRGKGTWPEHHYVRDDTWSAWRAEQAALMSLHHYITGEYPATKT